MLFRHFSVAIIALIFAVPTSRADLSKGHRIILDRGLQLQGLSQDDCYFHLNTFSNANYTSIDWINATNAHSSRPDLMGDAPGYLWSRWAADDTQMPPQITPYGGDETPYMSQLMALCLGDEWDLNNDTRRTELVNWFLAVRTNYPNTILYHNNWGTQIGDGALADFYTRAQPDMLCFDTYPWQSVWDSSQPEHKGPPIFGPPTGWYQDLRRYREHAKGAGIPFGIYRQTFHAVQDYNTTVYRDPSASELRLNTFGALAFNAKLICDFVYNTGANSLFTNTLDGTNYLGYAGDSNQSTNGLYLEMIDINKRAKNLGKALVRLTPISIEGHPGYTTSMMFLRGTNSNGTLTPIPSGFLPDQDTVNQFYTDWVYLRNDPYLIGWAITNKAAKNNGLRGDVILSWFKPLDEGFDGTSYNNQTYFMVVNGLTDPTGTAADCLQEVRLNFASTPPATAILLNPTNGLLQTNTMIDLFGDGSRRQLVLNLNGGDAALFKLNTGAPFVGFFTPPAPKLSIQRTNPVTLTIQGTMGFRHRVEVSSSLTSSNWTVLTNLVLPSTQFVFADTASSNATTRFYRAVASP